MFTLMQHYGLSEVEIADIIKAQNTAPRKDDLVDARGEKLMGRR